MGNGSDNLSALMLVSCFVWTAQDQLQRVEALMPIVSLSILVAVLLFFAGWVAWRACGSWRAAGLGAVTVTLGMQIGRFLSDLMSGRDWSTVEYLGFWSSGWPVLLVVNAALVLVLLLPIHWARHRWVPNPRLQRTAVARGTDRRDRLVLPTVAAAAEPPSR